jgi:SAM-dependent methyltransferase
MAGAEMPENVIRDFYETRSLQVLPRFRILCNALKATVLETAVREMAGDAGHSTPGRLRVLDLGCGRGGDLGKWSRYRLRSYVGLDLSRNSVEEARQRHVGLSERGDAVPARFEEVDCRRDAWPVADAAVDVVSAQFALQYFYDSESSWAHVEAELRRVLRPRGLLVAVLPDGNVVAERLLAPRPSTAEKPEHFVFEATEESLGRLSSSEAFGVIYRFALSGSGSCPEYAVAPRHLEERLSALGFAPVLPGGRFSVPAQEFLEESELAKTVLGRMLKDYAPSTRDWRSLHCLRVVMCRLGGQEEPSKRRRRRS